MNKNYAVLFLFVIVLCRMPLCAFSDDTNWQKPDSISDFAGIWEGFIEVPVAEINGTLIRFDMTLQYTEATNRNKALFTIILKIDLNAFMDFMMTIPEVAGEGLTKDQIWELLRLSVSEPGVTFGKYFITYKITEDADDFIFNDVDGQIFINKEKNKLLLIFVDDISQGFSDEAVHEIILTKK